MWVSLYHDIWYMPVILICLRPSLEKNKIWEKAKNIKSVITDRQNRTDTCIRSTNLENIIRIASNATSFIITSKIYPSALNTNNLVMSIFRALIFLKNISRNDHLHFNNINSCRWNDSYPCWLYLFCRFLINLNIVNLNMHWSQWIYSTKPTN